jgi:hypothetical protein
MMWGKNRRFVEAMRQQARDDEICHSAPDAVVLQLADNGPEHGWKWLTWAYDPDHKLLYAGAVEGVVVPYGMKDGYENIDQARAVGLHEIRQSGWTGDVVLREPVAVGEHLTR